MGKVADRYFEIHPWQVVEKGFNPDYGEVSESVFSLGNEYTGIRGYFDEGYSGKSLQGCYLNGLYESRDVPPSAYRGMLTISDFMVNTVDWVYTRICCNGVELDLAKCEFSDFVRSIDFRTGVLTRSFRWRVDAKTELKLTFERFTSMEEEQFCGQKLSVQVLTGQAAIRIRAGLDFTRPHVNQGKSMFTMDSKAADGSRCEIQATTGKSRQTLYAAAAFKGMTGAVYGSEEAIASNLYRLELAEGENVSLERIVTLICARNEEERAAFAHRCAEARAHLEACDYETMKAETAAWWTRQWDVSDIEIDGDEENQQGIRFCIFQLHQTLHTAKYGAVFGAKGLTGEAYNGNTFWDSEVYCLPFYLFNNPEAQRAFCSIVMTRCLRRRNEPKHWTVRAPFTPLPPSADGSAATCGSMPVYSFRLPRGWPTACGITSIRPVTGNFCIIRARKSWWS